jgi:RES domain-containing protein
MVWEISVWENQFAGLLDKYEAAPPNSIDGQAIEELIDNDWDIFSFHEHQRIRAFLEAAFITPHPLLEAGVLARRRVTSEHIDHIETWDRYVQHLKTTNRFFPPDDLPNDSMGFLGEVILNNSRTVEVGKSYYRGRPTDGQATRGIDEMGMPPAGVASGGRGNPIGIPHLYVASDPETCAAECRIGLNGHVSIATFRVTSELSVLDLAVVDSINPFTTDGDVGDYLQARSFLNRLRREISIPARSADIQMDYIATQFLCEYAKHLGLHGVMYPSTLNVSGTNLVLFGMDKVAGEENVELYLIVRDEFSLEPVENGRGQL